MTELCDGTNVTFTRRRMEFSRELDARLQPADFAVAASTHERVRSRIAANTSVFCECCEYVRTLQYDALPDYSLVFSVRDDITLEWWEWDLVVELAVELSLPTVPVLFRGIVETEDQLRELTSELSTLPSAFGGSQRGVVVRRAASFTNDEFPTSLAVWVQKIPFVFDEPWFDPGLRTQRLRRRPSSSQP